MSESRSSADQRLEDALKAVLDALPHATPKQRAILFKRAGDICVSVEERRKALGWYGRAVDQLLELGDAAEAARICRLIIFVQPDAVRARGTLTWIEIGTGQYEGAVEHLVAYAQAARQAGQTVLAAQQLGWMYDVAISAALRERILIEMRTLAGAERAAALAQHVPHPPPAALSPEQIWVRVLDATVGDLARLAREASR
jgi:hypothetical protein